MNKITYIRKKMKLSKTEFARKIGVSAAYITLLETGQRQISKKIILKLKELVPGIDTNIFFTNEVHKMWERSNICTE